MKIYMMEYWSELSDETYGDSSFRKIVPGSFVKKDEYVGKYEWPSMEAFVDDRRSWTGYVGKLFGGVVFDRRSDYGIRSFQLLKTDREFPDRLVAPWYPWWVEKITTVYHARSKAEARAYRSLNEDEHTAYADAWKQWSLLVDTPQERIEEEYACTA